MIFSQLRGSRAANKPLGQAIPPPAYSLPHFLYGTLQPCLHCVARHTVQTLLSQPPGQPQGAQKASLGSAIPSTRGAALPKSGSVSGQPFAALRAGRPAAPQHGADRGANPGLSPPRGPASLPGAPHRARARPAARTGPGSSGRPGSAGR